MAVLLEANKMDNVGSCSILRSRSGLFGIPQQWAEGYVGQPEGVEFYVALKTLVCAPNQRPNLIVLKFYLELIIHPAKRVKKFLIFPPISHSFIS